VLRPQRNVKEENCRIRTGSRSRGPYRSAIRSGDLVKRQKSFSTENRRSSQLVSVDLKNSKELVVIACSAAHSSEQPAGATPIKGSVYVTTWPARPASWRWHFVRSSTSWTTLGTGGMSDRLLLVYERLRHVLALSRHFVATAEVDLSAHHIDINLSNRFADG